MGRLPVSVSHLITVKFRINFAERPLLCFGQVAALAFFVAAVAPGVAVLVALQPDRWCLSVLRLCAFYAGIGLASARLVVEILLWINTRRFRDVASNRGGAMQ